MTYEYRRSVLLFIANQRTVLIDRTEVTIPQTAEEQATIVTALAGRDTEFDSLAARFAKAGKIKQDMIREFLTGKIPLI